MIKILITADVEHGREWEERYRTHGDLFRSQEIPSPVHYTVNDRNELAICVETDDVQRFMTALESSETRDAMKNDGVKQGTVRVFVLDREFSF